MTQSKVFFLLALEIYIMRVWYVNIYIYTFIYNIHILQIESTWLWILSCAIYVVDWNCLETGPIFGAYFLLFGIVWKQDRFLGHISSSGWKEMRHLGGIFWLGRLRMVEGCREIWGTCAIYVGIPSLILANEWGLRHLCPLTQPVAELNFSWRRAARAHRSLIWNVLLCARGADPRGKKHMFFPEGYPLRKPRAAWCWGKQTSANQLRRLQIDKRYVLGT